MINVLLSYWWIPIAIVMYSLYAFLTKQNNTYQTPFWFILMWVGGAIPLWNIISLKSKSLLVDGFLYDIIMLFAYVGTLIYLGEAENFGINQWIGMTLCIVGLILMKMKF